METTSIPDYPRGITFEQFIQSLQDLNYEEKEIAVVTYWLSLSYKQRESMTFEQKEQLKCINRWYDEMEPDFGDLYGNEIPKIVFNEFLKRGYCFTEISTRVTFYGVDNKPKTYFDILLESEDTTMAIMTKEKPDKNDIPEHIKSIEILRDHRRKRNDMRKVEGAIAGVVISEELKKAIIEAGLYVIEQSGDTMKIDVPDGFVPRSW